MNRVSTGAGLCALAAAVAGFPIINQFVGQQQAAQASPVLASAVSAAVMAQAGPTIVWYGAIADPATGSGQSISHAVYRAWSDGRIEMKRVLNGLNTSNTFYACNNSQGSPCASQWFLINDPSQGLAAKADITNDKVVDASDLSYLLAAWGDAPPVGIPPSDCPLNLINP